MDTLGQVGLKETTRMRMRMSPGTERRQLVEHSWPPRCRCLGRVWCGLVAVVSVFFVMRTGLGFSAAAEAEEVDYLRQVKPILETKCYGCHGVLRQKATLRLETRALMLAGGKSGAAVVAGDAANSLLVQRRTTSGCRRPRMARHWRPGRSP